MTITGPAAATHWAREMCETRRLRDDDCTGFRVSDGQGGHTESRLHSPEFAEIQYQGTSPSTESADRIRSWTRVVWIVPAVGRRGSAPVSVVLHTDHDTIVAFKEAVAKVTDVVERHSMFGRLDYVLRVAVTNMAA